MPGKSKRTKKRNNYKSKNGNGSKLEAKMRQIALDVAKGQVSRNIETRYINQEDLMNHDQDDDSWSTSGTSGAAFPGKNYAEDRYYVTSIQPKFASTDGGTTTPLYDGESIRLKKLVYRIEMIPVNNDQYVKFGIDKDVSAITQPFANRRDTWCRLSFIRINRQSELLDLDNLPYLNMGILRPGQNRQDLVDDTVDEPLKWVKDYKVLKQMEIPLKSVSHGGVSGPDDNDDFWLHVFNIGQSTHVTFTYDFGNLKTQMNTEHHVPLQYVYVMLFQYCRKDIDWDYNDQVFPATSTRALWTYTDA